MALPQMLEEALEQECDCTFPAKREEILDSCGEFTFETQNGTERTLTEIATLCSDAPEKFESAAAFYDYVYGLAPKDCIGREEYDDRGSNFYEREPVSF